MTYDAVVRALGAALRGPLPGAAAHALMCVRPPRRWPPGFNPDRVRHAAGLLLVYQADSQPYVVLTVRAETLGRHGGQVSLPGGVVEPGETFEQAALRESHEEIALAAESVAVLGPLTPVDIVVSGFRLHPIVACAAQRPPMHPADGEVGRILEVPIESLMDPAIAVSRDLERDGRHYIVPTFLLPGADLWGATAMVLAEFLVLLGWPGPSRLQALQ